MISEHAYAVILAGGNGKRLWPLSRTHHPKQFKKLTGDQTLLQLMTSAVLQVIPRERLCIQTTPQFVHLVQEQLPDLPTANILIESEGKDTAGAHAFAAATVMERDPEATLGVFYSDHHLDDLPSFKATLDHAFTAAEEAPQSLIVIGIKPLHPHTGLGYIKMNESLTGANPKAVYSVDGFVEKPSIKEAERLTRSWRYLWNTGYCVGKAKTKLRLLSDSHPDFSAHHPTLLADFARLPRLNFFQLVSKFPERLRVIPADFGWSDVGDWSSLGAVMTNKAESDTMVRRGPVADILCEDCLFYGEKRLLVGIGLQNVAIIDTEDALLVINKGNAQDLKTILDQLEKSPYRHLL
jgi:mannose-1-phosphate guanylyltransferase